ncbi:MAG: leucyl/phenylalanyl-tRNA--protein transferase [Litoreibacter sp.]|nr:leucyl/phenylalanyl-tRNA--protein transferase [Litoreibacter sp.]
MSSNLSPNLILKAYASGIFPMSESRDDERLFWVNPEQRGVIPLDGFHMSRSLRRTIRSEPFQIRVDADFAGTIEGCADREETWINDEIFSIYMELFEAGHAHSLEVWDHDELVGGVYGVALKAAFFGESMFSRRRDASKIALAYLVSRLKVGGFRLFDTQFLTDHLASLGGIEISRLDYQNKLRDALEGAANFHLQPLTVSGQQICSE